jgi:hypothetical protein
MLGLDIVKAGKSKQYAAAVECFGRAKRCFAVAGLPDCWDQLVPGREERPGAEAGREEEAPVVLC